MQYKIKFIKIMWNRYKDIYIYISMEKNRKSEIYPHIQGPLSLDKCFKAIQYVKN